MYPIITIVFGHLPWAPGQKIFLLKCLYLLFIDLKHSQSNVYSTLLVAYDTPTKRVEHAIFDWADLEINLGTQINWANKPTTYIHIPVKVK